MFGFKLLGLFILLLAVMALNADAKSERLVIKSVKSSSVENGNNELSAEKTIDGDTSSRWASDWKDPQWLCFDLGGEEKFDTLILLWESAYAKEYSIQTSKDALNWKSVFKEEKGEGNKETVRIGKQNARYIRLYCTKRGTSWGYSLHEFKVINSDDSPPSAPLKLSVLKGNNILAFQWDLNKEADVYAYRIYRSMDENGEYLKIGEQPVENSFFIDKSVNSGVQYYYYVKAVDYTGYESNPSGKISAVPSPIGNKGTYLDSALPVEKRVKDLISRMILEEKVEQAAGMRDSDDMTSYPNERLGIPSFKCADGPWGVRWENGTAFPVSIAVGATWDPDTANKIGIAMAKELKAKGRNMSLGPCLNLCRDPRGGRVHEGFGEDPYLGAKMAVAVIKGLQSQNVIATPKHFACNNKEWGRFGGPVEIDERTLREIYLKAFKACIKEGKAWSVMGAYNKINGDYCCASKYLLKDILKDEWGFKGFVVSDWFAVHETSKTANAGLDLEMPFDKYYGGRLLDAVRNGYVPEDTINDITSRILRIKFQAGLFEGHEKTEKSVVESKEHIDLAKESARKSIVLLKNENNLLPLEKNKIKKIAILGPSAKLTTAGMELGSGQVNPSYYVTPENGIKRKIGNYVKITNSIEEADAVIIFAGLSAGISGRQEGEGTDRGGLDLPGNQNNLIKSISKRNKNTIVVLIGGSAVTMGWIDSVPSVVQAWYCGQEGGTAIADALFGDYNPGGKLPITFPNSVEQLPSYDWDYRNEYKTGIGYPYYQKKKLKPLFPFGHGLSYTKFEYSALDIKSEKNKDGGFRISCSIKNTGGRKGDEVVQLYISDVVSTRERPAIMLNGFKRITLIPGETGKVSFIVSPEDLAFYDNSMKYIVEPGEFNVMVGSSSEDIRLKGKFNIEKLIQVKE